MKPIVVCGVDFSGTSMLAGMLHAAGVDMGDVESAEDVAASVRPIRYRMFEDRLLQLLLRPLREQFEDYMPMVSTKWLDKLYVTFQNYLSQRRDTCGDRPWGVKNNGILFLAMHPKFKEIPVQWLTTERCFEDIADSCFGKLGASPQIAACLGIEYLASWHLREQVTVGTLYPYDGMTRNPSSAGVAVSQFVWGDNRSANAAAQSIDSKEKGVIPWHGLLQPEHSPAPR